MTSARETMENSNTINCPDCGHTDPGPRCEHCVYCHRNVPEGFGVPGVEDDVAWANAVALHNGDCEWARTRAHRS